MTDPRKWLKIIFSIIVEICADNRPSDYNTTAASYCSYYSCPILAEEGYCDKQWNLGVCTESSEKIKDTCKVSCNNCGKSPIYSETILR